MMNVVAAIAHLRDVYCQSGIRFFSSSLQTTVHSICPDHYGMTILPQHPVLIALPPHHSDDG